MKRVYCRISSRDLLLEHIELISKLAKTVNVKVKVTRAVQAIVYWRWGCLLTSLQYWWCMC